MNGTHDAPPEGPAVLARERLDLRRLLTSSAFLGYLALHLGCLGVIWVGWSPFAVAFAVGLYLVRMFAITGFFHRYFSHRSFETSRVMQGLMAVIGTSSGQRGPVWWAAHHRHHHRYADQPEDIHSPRQHGLLWSHVGWIWSPHSRVPDLERVRDLTRFPELRWIDRHHVLFPVLLGLLVYALGEILARYAPGLGTNGPQLLVWGFCVSTVVLYQATYTINSLAHRLGSRRYATDDDSRNNLWLALLTLGEGWHNNHHRYPAAVRQGFFFWEIDLTWYVLWLFEKVGLVRNARRVPARVKTAAQAG